MVLVKLFFVFLKIGMFAIGGAYSFLPLIEKEVVERCHWLTKVEFLDMLGVVKAMPGAISIKFATYTGFKLAGIPGAIVANIGNLLSPLLIVIFVSALYSRHKDVPAVSGALGMIQLVMFAMIIAVAFQLIEINQLVQLRNLIVIIVAFTIFIYTKIHPAFIILSAGIVGALLSTVK